MKIKCGYMIESCVPQTINTANLTNFTHSTTKSHYFLPPGNTNADIRLDTFKPAYCLKDGGCMRGETVHSDILDRLFRWRVSSDFRYASGRLALK